MKKKTLLSTQRTLSPDEHNQLRSVMTSLDQDEVAREQPPLDETRDMPPLDETLPSPSPAPISRDPSERDDAREESSPRLKVNAQWGDLIGSTLGGCHVKGILGAGAMGVVFVGRHLALDLPVAIKCLPPHNATADARERFALEARAAAKLSHPHVVGVLHAGEERGLSFIVMELVEGESIEAKLQRRGALPIEEALGYCLDICQALDYAERRGIVHRDLKPANILVNRDGVAKVADLGLVKLHQDSGSLHQQLTDKPSSQGAGRGSGSLTQVGVAMGTPHYIAPEQVLDARSVDHRADLYSLGCTLYHMITGETLFKLTGVRALLKAHLSEPRPQADKVMSHLPSGLSALIERLTAINPEDRPTNAKAVEREIYALFDQWSRLPMPLQLSSERRKQRVTLHAQSLDKERQKSRRLTLGMGVMGGMLSIALILLFYLLITNTEDPTSTDGSTRTQGEGLSQRVNTPQGSIKTQGSSEDATLRLAYQTQRELDELNARLLSGDFQLISHPAKAQEHLFNALFHKQKGKVAESVEEFEAAYRGGLHQLDVVEDLKRQLVQIYPESVVRSRLVKLSSDAPSLSLTLTLILDEPQLTTRLQKLRDLVEESPSYLPALLHLIDFIESAEGQSVVPLLRRLEYVIRQMQLLEKQAKLQTRFLYKYYLDPSIQRDFRVHLSELKLRTQKYRSMIEDPLSVSITPTNGTIIQHIYPKALLFTETKSLEVTLITDDHLNHLANSTQEEMRPHLESLKFEPYQLNGMIDNHQLAYINHSPDFSGAVIIRIEDHQGLYSYCIYPINVLNSVLEFIENLQDLSNFKSALIYQLSISATLSPQSQSRLYLFPLFRAQFPKALINEYRVSLIDSRKGLIHDINFVQDVDMANWPIPYINEEELREAGLSLRFQLKLSSGVLIEHTLPLFDTPIQVRAQ